MYAYQGFQYYFDLINFLNENKIKKENILKICHYDDGGWGLILYTE